MPPRKTVKVLRNAPLEQALAQVRFATVLDMADRIPSLQRDFKAIGFPRFELAQFPQIAVIQGGQPKIQFANQWQFLSADRRSAIVLTTEFFTYVTSSYTKFEQFLVPIGQIGESLVNLGAVELMDRVGLRYIDVIRPASGETVEDYVLAAFLGLSETALQAHEARRVNVASETQFQTRYGMLAVKLRQLPADALLPPDLSTELVLPRSATLLGDTRFALDCDHYTENMNAKFEVAELLRTLENLHEAVSDAFRSAVKPHALSVWGPESEESQ